MESLDGEAVPWVCYCGFQNRAGNNICGGMGDMGCNAPRPKNDGSNPYTTVPVPNGDVAAAGVEVEREEGSQAADAEKEDASGPPGRFDGVQRVFFQDEPESETKLNAVAQLKAALMKAAAAPKKIRAEEKELTDLCHCILSLSKAPEAAEELKELYEALPRIGDESFVPLMGIRRPKKKVAAEGPTVQKATGRVKSYNTKKGFGFIDLPGFNRDIFVYNSHLVGRIGLMAGEAVEFELIIDNNRPQARQVKVVSHPTNQAVEIPIGMQRLPGGGMVSAPQMGAGPMGPMNAGANPLGAMKQAMSMGMQQNQSASDMRELALAMAAASAEVPTTIGGAARPAGRMVGAQEVMKEGPGSVDLFAKIREAQSAAAVDKRNRMPRHGPDPASSMGVASDFDERMVPPGALSSPNRGNNDESEAKFLDDGNIPRNATVRVVNFPATEVNDCLGVVQGYDASTARYSVSVDMRKGSGGGVQSETVPLQLKEEYLQVENVPPGSAGPSLGPSSAAAKRPGPVSAASQRAPPPLPGGTAQSEALRKSASEALKRFNDSAAAAGGGPADQAQWGGKGMGPPGTNASAAMAAAGYQQQQVAAGAALAMAHHAAFKGGYGGKPGPYGFGGPGGGPGFEKGFPGKGGPGPQGPGGAGPPGSFPYGQPPGPVRPGGPGGDPFARGPPGGKGGDDGRRASPPPGQRPGPAPGGFPQGKGMGPQDGPGGKGGPGGFGMPDPRQMDMGKGGPFQYGAQPGGPPMPPGQNQQRPSPNMGPPGGPPQPKGLSLEQAARMTPGGPRQPGPGGMPGGPQMQPGPSMPKAAAKPAGYLGSGPGPTTEGRPGGRWRALRSEKFSDIIVRESIEVASHTIRRIQPGDVCIQRGATMEMESGLVRMQIEPDGGWVTVHARFIQGPTFLEEVSDAPPRQPAGMEVQRQPTGPPAKATSASPPSPELMPMPRPSRPEPAMAKQPPPPASKGDGKGEYKGKGDGKGDHKGDGKGDYKGDGKGDYKGDGKGDYKGDSKGKGPASKASMPIGAAPWQDGEDPWSKNTDPWAKGGAADPWAAGAARGPARPPQGKGGEPPPPRKGGADRTSPRPEKAPWAGSNYASAPSGIIQPTGPNATVRYEMAEMLSFFGEMKKRDMIGAPPASVASVRTLRIPNMEPAARVKRSDREPDRQRRREAAAAEAEGPAGGSGISFLHSSSAPARDRDRDAPQREARRPEPPTESVQRASPSSPPATDGSASAAAEAGEKATETKTNKEEAKPKEGEQKGNCPTQ